MPLTYMEHTKDWSEIFYGENGERLCFISVKAPKIPEPAPLPQFPTMPQPQQLTLPPQPTIIAPQGVTAQVAPGVQGSFTVEELVGNRDLPSLQALQAEIRGGRAPQNPLEEMFRVRNAEDVYRQAAEARGRRELAASTLRDMQTPPAAEQSEIAALSERQFGAFKRRADEDAETARLRLMEELNARGLLGSTGDYGESGLRGKLEEARQKSLLEASERADLIAEDLRRTRRNERASLFNTLEAGASAKEAQALGLSPLATQISQAEAANQARQFQFGPLAEFQARVADQTYRSQIAAQNAQQALQASQARAASIAGLAGAGGMYAGLKGLGRSK